jgi:leucyl/phenylalanyl-tRNA--protein transferase
MRIPMLTEELAFPHPESASPEGIVAFGAEPAPERLLLAYASGIFPWPHEGLPLLWFSPDPRFVLEPSRAHIPGSLRKRIKRGGFEIRADTAFREVMLGCKRSPRPGQDGTWITFEMMAGYEALHRLGYAHSIEAWQDGELVGGLYGVSLGRMFTGESMFAKVPDASKVAFATLLGNLVEWGFAFVDCEVYTDHLSRFGAEEWPRSRFLAALDEALEAPTKRGTWKLDLDPRAALARLRASDASES